MKKFFEKVKGAYNDEKSNRRFKKAGEGSRLGETSTTTSQPVQRQQQPSREHGHTAAQAQAAAAAMARLESKHAKPKMTATERKARAELQKRDEVTTSTSEVEFIAQLQPPEAKQIELGGIYYVCPITGEVVAKSNYYEHLEQALDQLKLDAPIETAILKINCLNKNKEQRELGTGTLTKYLSNIDQNPNEEKFKKIKKSNKAFTTKILVLKGSTDFLEAIGWCETEIDDEVYFVHMGTHEQIKEALAALNEPAEVPKPTLFRNQRHLTQTDGLKRVDLPRDFFKLSTNEVKSIQAGKETQRKQQEMLMTSSMRENAALQEKRTYNYTNIRIRLPDSSFLEGTFNVYEKSREVVTFLREQLHPSLAEFQIPFQLKTTPDNVGVGDEQNGEKTLKEMRLYPAVTLNLQLDESIAAQIGKQPLLGDLANPLV